MKSFSLIKILSVGGIGAVGAAVSALFGGWDGAMTTLIIFMAIDYVSGIICAGIFRKSDKSKTGALESKAGFKGLCRKGMVLMIVLVAARLDIIIGSNYIKDMVVIAFITNETISIIENAGLMGVPMPAAVTRAIELLKAKNSQSE